jgi:hypothetical protein
MFNRYFNQLLKTPIWVKITLVFVLVYFAYWIFAHPLANFVFNGIVAIIPFFLKMLWALVKFFAILIVLQIIFAKTVTKSLHRKILWLAVICITSFVDQFGIFGEFSWNPLKIKSSFDYFLLQLQFLSFYYVILLLVLPRIFWSFLTQGFVIVMSLLSSGVGVIPLIGGFLSPLLSSVVTFSVLAFFVLNFVAMGLIALEKLIATKNS